MATNDLVFTIKDLDDDVKLGTAIKLGFDETQSEQTLDEFWLDYFHHRMLARMVKPAMVEYITDGEQKALEAASLLAENATQGINVEIS